MQNLRATTWVCLAGLAAVFAAAVAGDRLLPEPPADVSAADPDAFQPGSELAQIKLPDGPEHALLEQYCQNCHRISRIERAGGSLDGWTSRIERMIRNGSMIPKADVPALASYLAKALPERPPGAVPVPPE